MRWWPKGCARAARQGIAAGGPRPGAGAEHSTPLLAVHYEHAALECNCTAPAQAESAEKKILCQRRLLFGSAASSSVCVGRRKVSSITQRPVKENCLQEKLCTSTGPATMRRPHRRTRSVSSSLVQYLLLLAGPACKKKKTCRAPCCCRCISVVLVRQMSRSPPVHTRSRPTATARVISILGPGPVGTRTGARSCSHDGMMPGPR